MVKTIVEQVRMYTIQGDYKKALELLEPMLKSEDIREKLEAEYQKGYILWMKGEYDKAEEYLKKIIEECFRYGLSEIAGKCYVVIGSIYHYQGKIMDAIVHQRKALKIFRETGNLLEQARCLNSIGHNYREIQVYEEAVLFFSQALAIAQHLDNKRGMAYTNYNIADAYIKINQLKDAELYLKSGFKLFNEIKEVKMLACCYCLSAQINYKVGNYEESKRVFLKSIKMAGKDAGTLSWIYESQAEMYKLLNNKEKEQENLRKAIEYYKELKNEAKIGELEKKLVEIEFMTGKPIV